MVSRYVNTLQLLSLFTTTTAKPEFFGYLQWFVDSPQEENLIAKVRQGMENFGKHTGASCGKKTTKFKNANNRISEKFKRRKSMG